MKDAIKKFLTAQAQKLAARIAIVYMVPALPLFAFAVSGSDLVKFKSSLREHFGQFYEIFKLGKMPE